MARTHHEQKIMTRRAFVMGGVQTVAGLALASRLYYLQFVRGDEFTTEAEGNRIKVQLLVPPRGIITDRMGVVLAGNDIHYRLMLDRDAPADALKSFDRLAKMMAWPASFTKKLRQQIHPRRPTGPLLLQDHVPWEAMAQVEFHLPELPGVRIEEGQWRNYVYGAHGAHLIGYVGKVSEKEVTDQPLMKLPDMKIGKNGVEVLFEDRLRGSAGTKQLEVNVTGRVVRELATVPPVPGDTLQLSIDAALQEMIVQRLEGQSAAVVVMHVHTGEILALVSVPGFDPNAFSKGITQDYWNALNADEKKPLLNKAIAGLYPPGSTFKMLVGLAALKAGKIMPETKVYCPGHYYLGNHRFNCWKPEGHGHVNYQEAIAVSCDTFFYTVGRAAGIEAIADMAHEFGLGEFSGLGLRGERDGIIPSPEWKKAAGRGVWNPGETINTSIGQGDVLTSPLQLAIMMARMVNGGKKIKPRLTPLGDEKPDIKGYIDIDERHMREMLAGMDMVTNSPRGTAYWSATRDPLYMFGGKTGTSQVRRITVRGQDQSKIPWKFRHHALFVGYAPLAQPTYAIAVLVEHGGGGSSAAAPVARDVFQKTLELTERTPSVVSKEEA